MNLLVIFCVCHCTHQIVLNHFLKEEVHAGNWVKFHICIGCQEIDACCVIISPLNLIFLLQCGFESFRLSRSYYFFELGAGNLRGHHGGVIHLGHQPTDTHRKTYGR